MQHFFRPILPVVFALLWPALSPAQSCANPMLSRKIPADPSARLIVLYQEPPDILEIKEYRKNPEMAAWYKAGMDSVNQLRARDGKFKNSDQLQPPARTEILKQKTLLIPLNCLQSRDNKVNLIQDVPEEEVRKSYPYPFKIVSKKEIDAEAYLF